MMLFALQVILLVSSVTSQSTGTLSGSNMAVFESSAGTEMLRHARDLREYSDFLVDGTETLYDDYSQAWRLLGLYVDCSNQGDEERRRLGEEEQEQGEEEQEQEQEQGDEEQEQQDDQNDGCKRYILWAAYVDVDYQGGGSSEYQYFNTESKMFDTSSCVKGERCVRMDCHLQTTNFKLLGFFKEENPVNFMAILGENGGGCVWDNDEYDFMVNNIYSLPQGCTASGTYANENQQLYLDLKPKSGGGIDIGVYTDDLCSIEYSGGLATKKIWKTYVSEQASNANNGDDDAANYQNSETLAYTDLSEVNKALQAFHTCQPCRSCDGQGENQCSAFAQNGMSKASFQDVALARQQGAIQPTFVGEESWWARNGFLLCSILTFLVGLVLLVFATKKPLKQISVDSEPLIDGKK